MIVPELETVVVTACTRDVAVPIAEAGEDEAGTTYVGGLSVSGTAAAPTAPGRAYVPVTSLKRVQLFGGSN